MSSHALNNKFLGLRIKKGFPKDAFYQIDFLLLLVEILT